MFLDDLGGVFPPGFRGPCLGGCGGDCVCVCVKKSNIKDGSLGLYITTDVFARFWVSKKPQGRGMLGSEHIVMGKAGHEW